MTQNLAEDKMIISATKYALYHAAKKIPIKSADVSKYCLHNNSKSFNRIWSKATECLSDVYGIEVHEIRENTNRFFLCSSEIPIATEDQLTQQQRSESSLVYLVLSYIFMKGGAVLDNVLWAFFDKIGIYTREQHEHFGDAKKLIMETFVKQMYLKKEKIEVEGCDRFQFSWSHRAEIEFKKKDVLSSVAQILGKPCEAFPIQFNEVLDAEAGDAEESEDVAMDETSD